MNHNITIQIEDNEESYYSEMSAGVGRNQLIHECLS